MVGAPAASGGAAAAGESQAAVRRLGTTAHDGCCEDTYSALLQRFQRSEEELRAVAAEWLQCQKRIDAYVDEQVGVREGCARGTPMGSAIVQALAACRASGSHSSPWELLTDTSHPEPADTRPKGPTAPLLHPLPRLNGNTELGQAGGSSVGRWGTGPHVPACPAA